jgi:hypothetical protein
MDRRDDYKQLKERLHRKILERLDLEKLGQTPKAIAHEQVLNLIRNLISDEARPSAQSKGNGWRARFSAWVRWNSY